MDSTALGSGSLSWRKLTAVILEANAADWITFETQDQFSVCIRRERGSSDLLIGRYPLPVGRSCSTRLVSFSSDLMCADNAFISVFETLNP